MGEIRVEVVEGREEATAHAWWGSLGAGLGLGLQHRLQWSCDVATSRRWRSHQCASWTLASGTSIPGRPSPAHTFHNLWYIYTMDHPVWTECASVMWKKIINTVYTYIYIWISSASPPTVCERRVITHWRFAECERLCRCLVWRAGVLSASPETCWCVVLGIVVKRIFTTEVWQVAFGSLDSTVVQYFT